MKHCLELTSNLLDELTYDLENNAIVICYNQVHKALKDGTLEKITDQTKYVPQVIDKLKSIGLTIDDVDYINEHYQDTLGYVVIRKKIFSLSNGGEVMSKLNIYSTTCASVDLEIFDGRSVKLEEMRMPAKLSSLCRLDIEQFFLNLGKKFFGEGNFHIDSLQMIKKEYDMKELLIYSLLAKTKKITVGNRTFCIAENKEIYELKKDKLYALPIIGRETVNDLKKLLKKDYEFDIEDYDTEVLSYGGIRIKKYEQVIRKYKRFVYVDVLSSNTVLLSISPFNGCEDLRKIVKVPSLERMAVSTAVNNEIKKLEETGG